jgi:16S rRNA processing protein RimM
VDKIVVGKVGAPYGVRGWVKIHSFTDPIGNLFTYPLLLEARGTNQDWQTVEIEQFKAHGDGYVAKLVSIDDRDQAALLTNAQLAVGRDVLPEIEEDEFYWADLFGVEVINQDNINLGKIVDVFATGANDVIVVQSKEREHLIPYVPEMFVVEVDLDQKIMRVNWDAEF